MGVLLVLGVLVALVVCSLAVALCFSVFSWPPTSQGPAAAETKHLYVRDPQCGRIVARAKAVPAFVEGRRLYFCSRFCLLRYTRQRSRRPLGPQERRSAAVQALHQHTTE